MERGRRVITISRQIGSGGTYIGYELAKELGFMYVDREILRRAAMHLGSEERVLEAYEEKPSSIIEYIIKVFSMGAPESFFAPSDRPIYDSDLFAVESRIIREIVEGHDAVVIGRAGFHVLADRPGTTHVFIHAPLQFRIKRLMEVKNLSDAREARQKLEESDRRRSGFIRSMTRKEWVDARNYHLSVDSGAVGFPEAVRMITRLVERGSRDPGTGEP